MGLLRILLLTSLVLVAAAGCGGSDDSSSESPDERVDTTTAEAEERSSGGDADEAGEGAEGEGEDAAQDDTAGPLTPAERREQTDRIRALVREYIDALNARDESVCTRLFDRALIEPGERDDALAVCRRDVAQQPRGVKLVKIEIVRIRQKEGVREAGVQFLLSQRGRRTTRYAYHLIYKKGEYLIDRGIPVKQPR